MIECFRDDGENFHERSARWAVRHDLYTHGEKASDLIDYIKPRPVIFHRFLKNGFGFRSNASVAIILNPEE